MTPRGHHWGMDISLVLLLLTVVAAGAALAAVELTRRRYDVPSGGVPADDAEPAPPVDELVHDAVVAALSEMRATASAERDAAVHAALQQAAVMQRETFGAAATQVREQTSKEFDTKQEIIDTRLDQVQTEMRAEMAKLGSLVVSLAETSAHKFGQVDQSLRSHAEITQTLSDSARALREAARGVVTMNPWRVLVDTIKRELSDVRHSQSATERRTQDTLEALHSTLSHVVDRLAMIEGDLRRGRELIAWADHLAFVYPTWWGTMPALLKGFLDRALAPGFAFAEEGAGFVPLLGGRSAELLTTMDTPGWVWRWIYGAPGDKALARATLGFCGIKVAHIARFGPIKDSSAEQRRAWLSEARRRGARPFGRLLERKGARARALRVARRAVGREIDPGGAGHHRQRRAQQPREAHRRLAQARLLELVGHLIGIAGGDQDLHRGLLQPARGERRDRQLDAVDGLEIGASPELGAIVRNTCRMPNDVQASTFQIITSANSTQHRALELIRRMPV